MYVVHLKVLTQTLVSAVVVPVTFQLSVMKAVLGPSRPAATRRSVFPEADLSNTQHQSLEDRSGLREGPPPAGVGN